MENWSKAIVRCELKSFENWQLWWMCVYSVCIVYIIQANNQKSKAKERQTKKHKRNQFHCSLELAWFPNTIAIARLFTKAEKKFTRTRNKWIFEQANTIPTINYALSIAHTSRKKRMWIPNCVVLYQLPFYRQ